MAENRTFSDEVLLGLIKSNSGGGGGGGTSNYNQLENKPKIGGVTLTGNKSASDLGLASATDLANKVDKVDGKGLSTNDYTNADKAIVDGVTAALADKVDKVEDKGLSSNDFTDAYKTAIGDNTTAISGIMDGQTIDSFADVESALSDIDTTINGIKDGTDIDSFSDVETALDDKADKTDVKNEFIGTTAEWNALTTAEKKEYDTYQITDDYSEALMPNYSTTEQKTGQKWIDGKDIYGIVFANIGSVSLNNNDWTNVVELNAAEVISITVITTDNTINDGRLRWNYSNGYIRGAANNNLSYNIAYIIVEYTKTA